MTKKTLQNWYNSGDISYDWKKVIKRFGVGDYYPECALWDFKKLWYYNEIFERNKSKIPCRIIKLVFLSTDWNNNVIICVSNLSTGDKQFGDIYLAYLGVYEMKSSNMPEIFNFYELFCFISKTSTAVDHYVSEIKREVVGNNPIYSRAMISTLPDAHYLFHRSSEVEVKYGKWYLDEWNKDDFPSYYGKDEVMRFELSYERAKNNPDAYIKPLDIVKIFSSKNNEEKMERMRHACIYLGNGKIAHALADNSIVLRDWEKFFAILPSANKILRYHPVIAFKKPEKIIEHIARCLENTTKYFHNGVKNDFNILSNNCEYFANRCVLGLDFSELSDKKNGKGSRDFNIRDHHKKNEEKMNLLTSGRIGKVKEEINRCKNSVYHPQGIKMETQIEVSPKGCYWYRGRDY